MRTPVRSNDASRALGREKPHRGGGAQGDISTTTAEISAGGAAAGGEVSGGDLVDMFAVTGVEFDKRTTLTATTMATVEWKLSLVQAGANGTNIVATSTGTGNITVSADLDEANGTDVYAKVELTALGSTAASFGADVDATVSYSLSAENVATPGTVGFDYAAAEAFIPNGNLFSVTVSRTDGRTGAVKARVYLSDKGSAAEIDGGAYVGEIDAPDSSFGEWAGSYTVTFPESPSEDGDASVAFATLTISDKGVVKWSVTLSNGQVASGTSQLYGSDGKTAFAPLFKSTAKYAFSSLLKIRKSGGETWADQTANQIIHDAPGTATLESIGDDVAIRTALGGWWTPNIQPSALLDTFEYGNDLLLVSEDMEPYEVSASASGFAFKAAATRTDRLTYTKKTGAFAGSISLVTATGASVRANIKGVLLPGWDDCGCVEPEEGEAALVTRPFGAGIISYSVRTGRTMTTFSAPVYLIIDGK